MRITGTHAGIRWVDMKMANKDNTPLLNVRNLIVEFDIGRRKKIHAVSDISFHIHKGEVLGLVGESGCGKSTVARTIVQLQKASAGQIFFKGQDLMQCDRHRLRGVRPDIQMIFQDAAAALNPGRKVGKTIAEPLRVMGVRDRRTRYRTVRALMKDVGLDPDVAFDRQPFEFSGGQCQRISIARSLITKPGLLVCDEPVSSLDVSIQAQILNLLRSLKRQYDLTLLFISHDLAVVKNICDRIAVMYLGKLCETAPAESLYQKPFHPYSATLFDSVPDFAPGKVHRKTKDIGTEMPSPASPPEGCRFHTRCPEAQNLCLTCEPEMMEIEPGRQVACHFPL